MKKFFRKPNNIILILGFSVILFISVMGVTSFSYSANNTTEQYTLPPLPEKIDFCNEEVPIWNFDVKERLEKELLVNKFFHSQTFQVLRKTKRFLPVIEPILKKYNIPDDLKYISVIESNLENLVSYRGATGFWQLMPDAAKELGMEINDEIDERYHIEKSTEAACKYLLKAYQKFNNWTMAAASYNIGLTGISNLMEKQKTKNYYNIVMGEETSRYIFRILAIREIIKNPETFGFILNESDYLQAIPTYEVEINTSVDHWADYAISKKINYKILKIFNPWLRDIKLQNKQQKKYLIKIPQEGAVKVING